MRPRIVVINGGYRTGSTVAFNLVRELFDSLGVEYVSALRDRPAAVDNELAMYAREPYWAVLKCHVWVPMATWGMPGIHVLHTHRPPLDVAASMGRFDKHRNGVMTEVVRQAVLRRYHERAHTQRIHAPLLISYDYYYRKPVDRVWLIAEHLGLDVSGDTIERITASTGVGAAEKLSAGLDHGAQDRRTLIQGDHIGPDRGEPGHGERRLGPERSKAILQAIEAVMYP